MDESQIDEAEAGWTQRPMILAAIGCAAGIAVHIILGQTSDANVSAVQAALLMTVVLAAGLTGFTLERRLWWASLAFAGAAAFIGGLIVYWNGAPGGWSAGESWRTVCLLLAVAIAAPLFQAARDEGAARFPYPSVHDHAWTNAVLWGASWVFVGISLALLWLLSELFLLIKLSFLRDLLEKDWVLRALIGTAFGAALGLLRENDTVMRLLQRVVATVLAVLAPVLAVGLALFVLALPFTGIQALWDATSATTPILIACIVGALILANAVIGDMPAHERRFPALRYGALVLAVVMLPLAVLAAISTGLRIGQYGFTPERLWGLVFVAIACAWALAYFVSVVLGRRGWAARARPANLRLAFGVCVLALLLATPLISFNAISTRDQIARLESGKVTPDRFDWRALAFDFGEPGRAALKRLQASANPAIKAGAVAASKVKSRWDMEELTRVGQNREKIARNVRVLPNGGTVPDGLRDVLAGDYDCIDNAKCTLVMLSDTEAVKFSDHCYREKTAPAQPDGRMQPRVETPLGCQDGERYVLSGGTWKEAGLEQGRSVEEASRIAEAYKAGAIEVRTVPRRQVFVGGVPVGQPFE